MMLLADEELPWIGLVEGVVACEWSKMFVTRLLKLLMLTHLVQSVDGTSFGQVPIALHHSGLDGLHLARCQRLRLVIAGCLITRVIPKLKRQKIPLRITQSSAICSDTHQTINK